MRQSRREPHNGLQAAGKYALLMLVPVLLIVFLTASTRAQVANGGEGARSTEGMAAYPFGRPLSLDGPVIPASRAEIAPQPQDPMSTGTPEPACGLAWRQVPSQSVDGVDSYLSQPSALSERDAWAVGDYWIASTNRTLTEHWDGSQWSNVASPNPAQYNSLASVAALSTDNVWAVGYTINQGEPSHGMIQHWDGSVWSVVPAPYGPNGAGVLLDISARSASDIWAVGGGNTPFIVHWDGSRWTDMPMAPLGTGQVWLWGVEAVAANDVWATGQYYAGGANRALALHWNGASWTQTPLPDVPGAAAAYLFRVAASGANNVWTVGYYNPVFGGGRTLIYRWDGAEWAIVPSANGAPEGYRSGNLLAGVAALAPTDVWASGYYYNDINSYHTLIEHWDGVEWSIVDAPNPGSVDNSLGGLTALSPDYIWAAGNFSNGSPERTFMARYSDPCATPTPTATPTPNGCRVCNLEITSVAISCNPDGSVHWTATVRNSASCTVYAPWQAELQAKIRGGNKFTAVKLQAGGASYPPGISTVSGDICHVFAPNTNGMRVKFTPDPGSARCKPHAISEGAMPCDRAAACPQSP